jgi:hypothetical protein
VSHGLHHPSGSPQGPGAIRINVLIMRSQVRSRVPQIRLPSGEGGFVTLFQSAGDDAGWVHSPRQG